MLREPIQTIASKNFTATISGNDSFIIPFNDFDSILFRLDVSSLTGTSPTLDVYIQTTDDGGTTWYDVAHFAQQTGATTNPLFAKVSQEGDSYIGAVGDASIAAGSVSGLPIMNKLVRIKYVFGGTVTAADFTVKAIVSEQG